MIFFLPWRNDLWWAKAPALSRMHDHTHTHIECDHTTLGKTPVDKWSTERRDLYLTTHSTHNRQTSMPPAWFEPTIQAIERPQNHALDYAATGTGEDYVTIRPTIKITGNYRCTSPCLRMYRISFSQINAHVDKYFDRTGRLRSAVPQSSDSWEKWVHDEDVHVGLYQLFICSEKASNCVGKEMYEARFQNCEKRLLASSCLSTHLSAWINSAPTGRVFMKFHMCIYIFRISVEKI